jgi:hypothetical protein
LQRLQPLVVPEPGVLHRAPQHAERLVVDVEGHRERVAVLAAVRVGEPGGVLEPRRCAVHHLGHERERLHGARADSGHEQQLREIDRPAIGRGGERSRQALQQHVGDGDLVMGGQRQVGRAEAVQLAQHDARRTHELHLRLTRRGRAPVRHVQDPAHRPAVDPGMRLVDEAGQAFGQPVVAPRRALAGVHPLLHDRPMAVGRDDEPVQVERVAVLHRGAVDLGHEPRRARQPGAVQPQPVTQRQKFVRRTARVPAPAAADVQPQLVLHRREAALQRPQHRRRDAGRMPVHPHDGAERLEPEGMRQPPEELVAPVVVDDRLDHHAAQRGHAGVQPRRHTTAVERKAGAAGAAHDRRVASTSVARGQAPAPPRDPAGGGVPFSRLCGRLGAGSGEGT